MIWILLLLLAAPAAAANETVAVATNTTTSGTPTVEPFTAAAAQKLGRNEADLAGLRRQGFGKTEMLIFSAIAKASEKTWEALVKERLQGKPLRKLAEEEGLDYDALFERSSTLRDEIEMSLEIPRK